MENEKVVEVQKIPDLNLGFYLANDVDQKLVDRFWKKIDFPDDLVDGCWNWMAGKNKDGYGQFSFESKTIGAHRFSYMLFKGEIGEDLVIRHSCDNPNCVNPNHLLIGTRQDNSNDMVDRNRQNPAKGEYAGLAKLTDVEVDEILLQLLQKVSVRSLLTQFNVSNVTIYNICKGKIWKHCYDKLSDVQKQQLNNRKRESEDNGMTKLTDVEVDEILAQSLQKIPRNVLSIQYGISDQTIYCITSGKSWKQCYDKLSDSQKRQLHPLDLSSEETEEIRELYKTMTQVDLGIKYNLDRSTIRKIIKKTHPYDY